MKISLSKNLLLGLLMILNAESVYSQFSTKEYVLNLQTEKLVFSPKSTAETLQNLKAAGSDGVHVLLKSLKNLTESEKKELDKVGLKVLSPIKHSTYLARLNSRFNPNDKTAKKYIANIALLKSQHKVNPLILDKTKTERAFTITPEKGAPYNYVINKDGTLNLWVQFFPDVDEKGVKSLLNKYTKSFEKISNAIWEISLSRNDMLRIANEDPVLYIDAIGLPYMPENEETREIVHVNEVQEFSMITGEINGLGGQGVDIAILDGGVDQDNRDFEGRVSVWSERKSKHGTHVAGIAMGSGRMSNENDNLGADNGGTAFQWRGMAPQARLIDGFNPTAPRLFSWIRENGLDILNRSVGLSYNGKYNTNNQLVDEHINGTLWHNNDIVPARLTVFSAGNEGNQPSDTLREQRGYFSLTKQVKNAVLVGNFNTSNDDFFISRRSSLGPTYDGRIKPDVVAPGTEIISTGYCNNNDADENNHCPEEQEENQRTNYYLTSSGTSMAAPVVTGSLALVLQRWAIVHQVNLDNSPPLPSTLRAILIHSARDLVSEGAWFENADGPVQAFIGPDFTTGWGMVDAQAAVNAVSGQRVIENSIAETCNTAEYSFYVGSNSGEIKATLAWDDIASTGLLVRNEPLLINDLDLELIDPNGKIYYPWLLNQQIVNASGNVLAPNAQICGTELEVRTWLNPTLDPNFDEVNDQNHVNDDVAALRAAERGKDHLNNIEVVQTSKITGTWKAIVRGFNIADGPQNFSLILPKSDSFTSISDFCNTSPILCKKLDIGKICARRPELCTPPRIVPGKLGPKIKFRSKDEFIIIQVNKICQYVIDCPNCTEKYCAGYDIQMQGMPDGFKIEVYDSNAKQLFKNHSTSKNKGFKLKTNPQDDYFMIIRPGEKTVVDKEYLIPIAVKRF